MRCAVFLHRRLLLLLLSTASPLGAVCWPSRVIQSHSSLRFAALLPVAAMPPPLLLLQTATTTTTTAAAAAAATTVIIISICEYYY